MIFYLDHFFQLWVLPPGSVLLVSLLGGIMGRFRPVLGKRLVIFALISLYLLSTPLVAENLLQHLQEKYPPLLPQQLTKPAISAAIVVLEAGLDLATPEYGGDPIPSETTLARLRYAAFLHEETHLPILVSGNDPSHSQINQADYMAEALKTYFHVPTRWKDSFGYNTAQEAIFSTAILKKSGIKTIYLVTSASHMQRAVYAFQHKGLTIIPAATQYNDQDYTLGKISIFLPSIDGLNGSCVAIREYVGLLWYHLYYRF